MKQPAVSHRFAATGRHQRGASLLEGIAYLGIAAIVILGAISLLTGAFSSAQSNRAVEEVVAIQTAVKKLFIGQANNYGTVDMTTTLISAGIFPTTLSRTANTVTNQWNGAVTVGGTTTTFSIAYAGVPQSECITMVSGASGWVSIDGGGGTLLNMTPGSPATPAEAASICLNATNKITWTSN
jgi:hypothetical protein